MLIAAAVLALIDAAPAPVVEMTLTGTGNTPVSAAPRSLSDVARELREGRKAVGGFSAFETTVRRNLPRVSVQVQREEEAVEPEPEVVIEPEPPYAVAYVPVFSGGRLLRRGLHRRFVRHVAFPLMRPGLPSPPARFPRLGPSGHSRRSM